MKNETFTLALSFAYRLAVLAGVFALILHGCTLWIIPASIVLFLFAPSCK
jgi:hypothetical protein